MKKLIALLLAAILLVGALPLAGAEFNDSLIISEDYDRAVAEMSNTNVIGGFADGSFGPRKTLTRAQAAKIINALREASASKSAASASSSTSSTSSSTASQSEGYGEVED